jgi:hypothetical protein
MKPIISKNLTPLPPSLQGNGVFKASPVLNVIPFPSPLRRGLGRGAGERFGEGSIYTLKTFQTSSYIGIIFDS